MSHSGPRGVYIYNALGQPKKAHYDRNGTLHGFAFDVVGRQTDDLILLTGEGVDDAVIWLQTGYDTAGRPALFTSRDDPRTGIRNIVYPQRFLTPFLGRRGRCRG